MGPRSCLSLVFPPIVLAFGFCPTSRGADGPSLIMEYVLRQEREATFDAKVFVSSPFSLDPLFAFGIGWEPDMLEFQEINWEGTIFGGRCGPNLSTEMLQLQDPQNTFTLLSVIASSSEPCEPSIPSGMSPILNVRFRLLEGVLAAGIFIWRPSSDRPPQLWVDGEWRSVPAVNGGVEVEIPFLRGDVAIDGQVDLADAIESIGYLFQGKPIFCKEAADGNDDGRVDIADPIYLLLFLYLGGNPPPEPFFQTGFDEKTPDGLGCNFYPS
jgi:hypothetical protein